MHPFSFEKLEVWLEAKELTKRIYNITNHFPESEKFGLTSQLRRATVSICSNLAEGSARISYKDKAHFSVIAYSSCMEVLNQIIISFELGFVPSEDYTMLRSLIEAIANKLNALRNYQLKQLNP